MRKQGMAGKQQGALESLVASDFLQDPEPVFQGIPVLFAVMPERQIQCRFRLPAGFYRPDKSGHFRIRSRQRPGCQLFFRWQFPFLKKGFSRIVHGSAKG